MVEYHWARYKGDHNTRYLLAFHLGVRDGKHCLLECSRVPSSEVEILKAIRHRLNGLSLGERIAMVKEICPIGMRSAYRQIDVSRYEVVRKY